MNPFGKPEKELTPFLFIYYYHKRYDFMIFLVAGFPNEGAIISLAHLKSKFVSRTVNPSN
jgi:hypothetical protein